MDQTAPDADTSDPGEIDVTTPDWTDTEDLDTETGDDLDATETADVDQETEWRRTPTLSNPTLTSVLLS